MPNLKTDRYFANYALIFTGGVKKCEIWPRFSIQVAYEWLQFRNRETYGKSITSIGRLVMGLGSSIQATLRIRGTISPPNEGDFVESSIARRCILLFIDI